MKSRAWFASVVGVMLAGLLLAGCGSDGESDGPGPQTDAACTPTSEQFNTYPAMEIDPQRTYTATFDLAKGDSFEIELYADEAPKTVNSFVFLARKKFFDCVTFHRVLDGFMAQGGDPTGTGTGGPGYEFEYEDSGYSFDKAGVVAMANNAPATATNGSQFFITFGPADYLDGGYTIFGQVTEGMDVVNAITRRDPTPEAPAGDTIKTVTISES